MNKDGGAVFPVTWEQDGCRVVEPGMTMRQAYKLAGLTGWLAGIAGQKFMDDYDDDSIAFAEHQMAVARAMGGYADAMLAEDAEFEARGK